MRLHPVAAIFCAQPVLAEFLVLPSQCFNLPFPSSVPVLCSRAGPEVELVSLVHYIPFYGRSDRSLPTHFKKRPGKPFKRRQNIAWTRPPVCTQILEGVKEPLCVYTSETFAEGRGISVVTTISYAKRFAALPAFQTAGTAIEPSRKWTTKPLPGKGIGMLATEEIRRGELIFSYPPVLLVHNEIQRLISPDDAETLIRKAISFLPAGARNMYMSLATSLNMPEYKAQDIILTNSFEIYAAGEPHIAIVPEPSRMNHDCAPNAIYHIDHDNLVHRTFAVRNIAAGEEITTAYSNILEGREIRRANLKNAFRFDCGCDRCMEKGKYKNSEERTQMITKLEERLRDWSGTKYDDALGPPSVHMAEELVKLYEQEGLFSHIGKAYGHAAMRYSSVRNREKALQYVLKALEAMEMKDGPGGGSDGPHMYGLKDAMTNDASKHWSWGLGTQPA